jgi:TcpE family
LRAADPEPGSIRSYQRIFRPERRLYQIEGRRLPVPGGVPLRWLGWAAGTLLAVVALSARSATVAALAAAGAALAGLVAGGRGGALAAAAGALLAVPALGLVLGGLDWPLRLVVLPALVATLATQATPDGRRAHSFAWSWLSLRLAARRRTLGRPLPLAGRRYLPGGELWVAACEDWPRLRRGRIRGRAVARFARPVWVRRGRLSKRRLVARPLGGRLGRRRVVVDRLELGAGEALELRP